MVRCRFSEFQRFAPSAHRRERSVRSLLGPEGASVGYSRVDPAGRMNAVCGRAWC